MSQDCQDRMHWSKVFPNTAAAKYFLRFLGPSQGLTSQRFEYSPNSWPTPSSISPCWEQTWHFDIPWWTRDSQRLWQVWYSLIFLYLCSFDNQTQSEATPSLDSLSASFLLPRRIFHDLPLVAQTRVWRNNRPAQFEKAWQSGERRRRRISSSTA